MPEIEEQSMIRYHPVRKVIAIVLFVVGMLFLGISLAVMEPILCGITAILFFMLLFVSIRIFWGSRDIKFKRWYKKKTESYPNRTYYGVMPPHLREMIDRSNFSGSTSATRWWVSIQHRGHTVCTGTFFVSQSSLLSNAPDKFYMGAIIDHPIEGDVVSFEKEPWGANLAKKMGAWKYKLGNKEFEDKYQIHSNPKDAAQRTLTKKAMKFILDELNEQEFYIGYGMLIVSQKIHHTSLYDTMDHPRVECVLERWNLGITDRIIELHHLLLEKDEEDEGEILEL